MYIGELKQEGCSILLVQRPRKHTTVRTVYVEINAGKCTVLCICISVCLLMHILVYVFTYFIMEHRHMRTECKTRQMLDLSSIDRITVLQFLDFALDSIPTLSFSVRVQK